MDLARDLITEFCPTDGVVLDPFLGSGSTSLGVQEAGGSRLGIGCEINEMPIQNLLLTLGANPGVDPGDLRLFEAALDRVGDLYRFTVNGSEVTLTRVIHLMEESLVPVAFVVDQHGTTQTLHADDGTAFSALRDAYETRLAELPERVNTPLAENSRIAVRPGMRVSDVFGPLGFEALSILREAGEHSLLVRLVVASGLHLCRLTDAKSQSQFPYWYPKQDIYEKSVHSVMWKQKRAIEQLFDEQRWFDPSAVVQRIDEVRPIDRPAHLIFHGPCAEQLAAQVPDGSVDLVVTDPPYFDQVAYSEYLKLWEHFTWLRSDLDAEIVESSRAGGDRSRARYLTDIEIAFSEVRRTLKDDATVLLYFKDSKPRNVHDFISALGRAGLAYAGQRHLPKPSYTYKQNATKETTVGGDAIMIFVPSRAEDFTEPTPETDVAILDTEFIQMFRDYVDEHGPASLTEALDNRILEALYRRGYLALIKSAGHFSDVIRREFTFDPSDRRWSPTP